MSNVRGKESVLFEGFEDKYIEVDGATIRCRVGGEGPPLLLLHGYPQTHVMWHGVVERLKDNFTIVASDLRGYGDSSTPPSSLDHTTMSKRAMSADQVAVMNRLGFERFFVGAHDRGARVAHRMAIDFPDQVLKMVLLDIAPTREMYERTDFNFAQAYWHWYYLTQPAPMPEAMIGADPVSFWKWKCISGDKGDDHFTAEALAEYLRCFSNPEVIRCSCEDYRAAATIDLEHDAADGEKKFDCPTLVLWGAMGVIEACFDAVELWKLRGSDIQGHSLPGGHYLAEELPDETATAFLQFFQPTT